MQASFGVIRARLYVLILITFLGCGPQAVRVEDDPYAHTYRYNEQDGRWWTVEFQDARTARFSYFLPERPAGAPSGPYFPYLSTEVTIVRREAVSFALASTSPSGGQFEKSRLLTEGSDSLFDPVEYRTQFYRLVLQFPDANTSVTLDSGY